MEMGKAEELEEEREWERGRGRATGERQGPSSSSLIRCLRAVRRTSLTKGETSLTLQLLSFIFQSFGYFNTSSTPFIFTPSLMPFLSLALIPIVRRTSRSLPFSLPRRNIFALLARHSSGRRASRGRRRRGQCCYM